MRYDYNRPMFSGMPEAGPVTKWLCALLVVVSVASVWSERVGGPGASLLVFHSDAVLHAEIWRLFTYPFVETQLFGMLLSCVVLFLFGRTCESSWGSGDFLRFFAFASVGAALIAMPISLLVNTFLPFHDPALAEGPGPAFDAMLVALALNAPDSNILFGFVLPMPARTVIWILLGIQVVSGLMTGAANLGITLGGMAMGYFLVTGNWRPAYLYNRIRMWRLRRRRDGLYVVPPRDKQRLN